MARLRTLVIILILLNLLAAAGLMGWLGSPVVPGEPERLTNQLNPERIKLRSAREAKPRAPAPPVAEIAPPPAPPPVAAAPEACMAFAGLNAEAARSLSDGLATRGDLTVRTLSTEVPSSWWVNLPPAQSKEAAEASVAELRSLGVTDLFIVQDAGPNQFAVSLGLFKQEAQAQRLVEQLQAKGVAAARASPRGSTVHRVEIRGTAERLETLGRELAGRYRPGSRVECQP